MLDTDTIERLKDGHLVPHFLSASYCYYHLHLSPMTDAAFDRLCVRLKERWDFISPDVYPHKSLIEYDSLGEGTGYYIPEDKYPGIVRTSAYHYFARASNGDLANDLQKHLLPPRSLRVARTPPAIPVVAAPSKPGRIVRTPPKGS